MGRIRTVKPELASHEGLFDLEVDTGLPIRFAWAMLPTVCDREGRFVWRPRTLKAQVLPHDDLDFSRVLDAWLTRGFLVRYRVGDAWYGWLPTFTKHQVVNPKESASTLPAFEQAEESEDYRNQPFARVNLASGTREARVTIQNVGKGKEGKEGKELSPVESVPDSERPLTDIRFDRFWEAYPRREGKKDALKAFRRINPDHELLATMLDAIRKRKLTPQWQDPRYIPLPASWLNQERWNDELAVVEDHDEEPPVYEDLREYNRKQREAVAAKELVTPEQVAEMMAAVRSAAAK